MQGEFLWLGMFRVIYPTAIFPLPRKGGQAGTPSPACLMTFLEQHDSQVLFHFNKFENHDCRQLGAIDYSVLFYYSF